MFACDIRGQGGDSHELYSLLVKGSLTPTVASPLIDVPPFHPELPLTYPLVFRLRVVPLTRLTSTSGA
jgi:hypothetical protein